FTGEHAGSSAFVAVTGTGVQLNLLGQTLSGNVAIQRDPAGLRVTASNVTLELSDRAGNASPRGPPLLRVTNGSGDVVVSSSGVSGTIAGTVQLLVPGVSLGGTFSVAFGAAGFSITGTGVSLSLLGQSLSGDFTIEQETSSTGAITTHVTAANVT